MEIMQDRVIGCLMVIAFLFIRLIIEFLRNLNKDKLIDEQQKLIKKQEAIINGFNFVKKSSKEIKENKDEL